MKPKEPKQPKEPKGSVDPVKPAQPKEPAQPEEPKGSMRRLAVWNQKGGTCKTTTVVNLAAALGEGGARVLVVDLDPQGDASDSFGVPWEGKGLLDVFQGERELASLVQSTSAPGVDLIPSSQFLVGLERSLAGEVATETILRRALDALPARWDVVLLDCPPSVSLLPISALAACSEVVVPVFTQFLPLKGVAALLRTLDKVRAALNPGLRIVGVLACVVDGTRLSREVTEKLRTRFASEVFRTVVRKSTRLAEAASHKMPVTLYDPEGNGAADYRALAGELFERLDIAKPTKPKQPKDPLGYKGSKESKR